MVSTRDADDTVDTASGRVDARDASSATGGRDGSGGMGGTAGNSPGTGGIIFLTDANNPRDAAADPAPAADMTAAPAPDMGQPAPDMMLPPADLAPSSTLQQGLVGHWKLDEASGSMAADSSGNNNGGTLMGGPAWTQGGFPGAMFTNPSRLKFDGIDDMVELGTNNIPPLRSPTTISVWFNYTAVPSTTAIQTLVSLTDSQDASFSRLNVGIRWGNLAAWKDGNEPLVTRAAPNPGWHHAVYTFDGTTHTLYLDGTRVAYTTMNQDMNVIRRVRIGANHDRMELFAGDIDDVRIYNRALTASEVTALRSGQN